MGLDITAYRQLMAAGDVPVRKAHEVGPPPDGIVFFWVSELKVVERQWPGGTRGLKPRDALAHRYADSFTFRAGSYHGHADWLSWLAKISGWGSFEQFWKRSKRKGPFCELLEAEPGVILGPSVAKKLAQDFAAFEGQAQSMNVAEDDDDYFAKYLEWKKACEMAADGGCLQLH